MLKLKLKPKLNAVVYLFLVLTFVLHVLVHPLLFQEKLAPLQLSTREHKWHQEYWLVKFQIQHLWQHAPATSKVVLLLTVLVSMQLLTEDISKCLEACKSVNLYKNKKADASKNAVRVEHANMKASQSQMEMEDQELQTMVV